MRRSPVRRLAVVLALVGAAPAAAQDPCANRKTGSPPRAAGMPRPPLVLGDSSQLLAVEPLVRLGLESDARGCRPLSDAVAIMAARDAAGTLPRVVVLGVGANGGIERSLLRRALAILGRDGRLGLVTPATTPSAAAAMRTFHAAHERRTVLVDWAASGLWQRYGGDGIHIGYEGEAVLARFIARHVEPYVPPRGEIDFDRVAEDCGTRGRLAVVILRGRERATCRLALRLAGEPDPAGLRFYRWLDWTFLGDGPWRDVFVRRDGKVVVATRTPAPAPPPDSGPPAR